MPLKACACRKKRGMMHCFMDLQRVRRLVLPVKSGISTRASPIQASEPTWDLPINSSKETCNRVAYVC